MTKKLLNFGFKNLLALASLTGCAQLKMKQPMAQFLPPQNESSQFLGVSEQIEQQIKPIDATTLTSAQITYRSKHRISNGPIHYLPKELIYYFNFLFLVTF